MAEGAPRYDPRCGQCARNTMATHEEVVVFADEGKERHRCTGQPRCQTGIRSNVSSDAVPKRPVRETAASRAGSATVADGSG